MQSHARGWVFIVVKGGGLKNKTAHPHLAFEGEGGEGGGQEDVINRRQR